MSSQAPSYRGYRFPCEIISHAVCLYYRFALSFRDVEDLLAQRSITVTYETIRQWCLTFGAAYARTLRHRRGPQGDTWHLEAYERFRATGLPRQPKGDEPPSADSWHSTR